MEPFELSFIAKPIISIGNKVKKTIVKESIKSKILLRVILFLNILLPHSSINVISIALNNS